MPPFVAKDFETSHYTVDNFTGSGQLSYDNIGPGQDPSMFEALTNIMPISRGGIERRWGYGLFSSPSLAATRFTEYQSDSLGSRYLVLSSASAVKAITESGTVYNSGLYTPTAAPRMVSSRDYGFFCNGVDGEAKKWNGSASGGTSKWGMLSPKNFTNAAVAANAGTVADVGGGTFSWTNPTNAQGATNGTFATATSAGTSGSTSVLKATNFGFSIPANARIYLIDVRVDIKSTVPASGYISGVQLYKAGRLIGDTVSTIYDGTLSTSVSTLGYRGQYFISHPTTDGGDTWGTSFTATDVNASNFGVGFTVSFTGAATVSIDSISINVYYATGLTIGATSAGNVSLTVGRKYFWVYKNSTTNSISDLSVVSASTGAVTSVQIPLSNITSSSDTQVDRKLILATADGGDETQLYLLADISAADTTYTDNVPEATLLLNPIYLELDADGNEVGVTGNQPPPALGILPLKHRGRLWMVNGQYLYFSKSLSEITTSDGTVCGRYEECWPADYVFDISEGAETIRAIKSDGVQLYVATDRHVRRISGDSPSNFSTPEIVFNDVGVVSPEAWVTCFIEEQPVGTVWFTPDLKVIASDFSTYHDIGGKIQNVLNTTNTAARTNVCATYVGSGVFDLFVLAIPTGSNTNPDTLCVYDLRNKQWFVWSLADSVTSFFYNRNSSGIPQWLFAAGTGTVYKFDSSYTQDRTNNTPVSITSTVQTTFLDFGDPKSTKLLNELEVITAESGMTVTIHGATKSTQFANPTVVVSNAALTTGPLGEYKIMLAGKVTKDRYYRFKFVSTGTQTFLFDSFSVEYIPQHRI